MKFGKHVHLKPYAAFLLLLSSFSLNAQTKDKIDYVNPMIGASTSAEAGKSGHGLGKTFPGTATPFGLIQLSPDTKTEGDNGPGYSWHHSTIEGFSFLHMSGIGWYGDFGNFLVTPTVGALKTAKGPESNPNEGYRSNYNHARETARIGYYSVWLDDYDVKVELTSAPRAGMIKMTYPESDSSRIQIDLARRIGGTSTRQHIKITDQETIEGWIHCPDSGGGWGHGDGKVSYTVYFYCKINKPLKQTGVWSAEIPAGLSRRGGSAVNMPEYQQAIQKASVLRNVTEFEGDHIGFFTEFPTKAGEEVLLKCGLSFVSIEGAKKNLEQDIPHWNFERVEQANRKLWSDALSNVQVEGATDREKTIFYTSLYHTMIDPRSTSDADGKYVGADGQVHVTDNFVYRTIFSGWDVFRSQFPLQTIINPSLVNDEINTLIHIAERSGKNYYPRWEIMNAYSGCMIGNPAVSVIVDAYNKGIRNYDVQKAYDYSLQSIRTFTNNDQGYTPSSISHTLEYCYFDWCLGKFAGLLGDQDTKAHYYKRSAGYKNSWCKEVDWFRGRKADGSWVNWKNREDHNHCCVESNPYQQGWFVPHDVYGLIDLMGKEAFARNLEEFFDKAPDDFLWNDYYNHPNEPVHQVPFMFPYTDKPYLTQKWTRRICDKAYGVDVMGLCGNEDVGQMSAWYVLAAMGIHPVNPGDNVYILTSPVFSEVEISLDKNYYKGGSFKIVANNNSPENIYIKEVRLNGKKLNRLWITHNEIVSGGTLEFDMSNEPNPVLGTDKEALPPNPMNS